MTSAAQVRPHATLYTTPVNDRYLLLHLVFQCSHTFPQLLIAEAPHLFRSGLMSKQVNKSVCQRQDTHVHSNEIPNDAPVTADGVT